MTERFPGYVIRVKDGEHEVKMIAQDPLNPQPLPNLVSLHADLRAERLVPDEARLWDMLSPLHEKRKTMIDNLSVPERGEANAHIGNYTNAHDVNNENISKQVTADKFYGAEGELHKSYDAVTKLAGEGARFQCVRNTNANQQLTSDSLFKKIR